MCVELNGQCGTKRTQLTRTALISRVETNTRLLKQYIAFDYYKEGSELILTIYDEIIIT